MTDADTISRRTINYFRDLLNELIAVKKGESNQTYEETYRQFNEARKYALLNQDSDGDLKQLGQELQDLVAPSVFNKNVRVIMQLTGLGVVANPFVTIMIFAFTFPVSIPYLVIRAAIIRKTRTRIDMAILGMTRIVNRLIEQSQK